MLFSPLHLLVDWQIVKRELRPPSFPYFSYSLFFQHLRMSNCFVTLACRSGGKFVFLPFFRHQICKNLIVGQEPGQGNTVVGWRRDLGRRTCQRNKATPVTSAKSAVWYRKLIMLISEKEWLKRNTGKRKRATPKTSAKSNICMISSQITLVLMEKMLMKRMILGRRRHVGDCGQWLRLANLLNWNIF